MINTVFTDILRTADSDHEIYFLLTSYIEAVRFSNGSNAMPADLQRLPLHHDVVDVKERFEKLIAELDAASKGLDDSGCVLLREALHIFGTALDRLQGLASEHASASAQALPTTAARTAAPAGASETVDVLLVEDNPYDVRMARKALDVTGAPYHLHVVKDGDDAMAYLCQAGEFDNAPRPDVVLIDLSIPRLDAQEVLNEIKSSDALKHVPVVVLTYSIAERHIPSSRRFTADHFVIKPLGLESFANEMKKIDVLAAGHSQPALH